MTMLRTLVVVAALAVAAPAAAQDLASAVRGGIIGERYDGYMGFAGAAPESLRKQVAAINIRRRSLYIGLASRRRVTPQVAGIAAGCELFSRLAVGQSYMLADGVWRRRAAGEAAPRPAHCGGS